MADDPRQELEELRRLDELEAKAQGRAPSQTPQAQPESKGLLDTLADSYKQMQDRNLNIGKGATEALSMGNIKPGPIPGVEDMPGMQGLGKVLGTGTAAGLGGMGAGALMPKAAGLAAGLGRTAINGLAGGAQGALQAPGEGETRSGNALRGASLGTLLGGAGEALSGIGSKVADKAMQYAVGMRKFIPGAGNRLVNQGLMGTKDALEGQVGRKLPEVESQVQDLVQSMPNKTPASELADSVSKVGNKFKLSDGTIPDNVQPYADKVRSAAEGINKLGDRSAVDLLKLKRQGDYLGYTASGNPATSLEAELGQAQGDKARELLSSMSSGQTADKLADEQALILAKKALQKPESIHQGIGSNLIFHRIPGGSLLGSAGAQASQKGLGGIGNLLSNPYAIQLLLQGTKNSSEK